jgi:mannose-6-phosphate isomerase
MPGELPPFLPMRPHLVEKVWGGIRLATQLGKEIPGGKLIGESWEVADLPQGQSVVAEGPLKGQKLGEIHRAFGPALVGSQGNHQRFPLLIKILDASADLSIQVHPGDGPHPKDECWIDLGSEPDAQVLHGLVPGTTQSELLKSLDEKMPETRLRAFSLKDTPRLHIPPGTIHAVGRGALLLEVQLPSDTTYRVWDYERPGLDGKPRALHLDDALAVMNFEDQPDPMPNATALGPGHRALVDAPHFRVESLELGPAQSHVARATRVDSPLCVFAMGGSVTLRRGEIENALAPGQSAVIPAQLDGFTVHAPDQHARLYLAGLGGPPLLSS